MEDGLPLAHSLCRPTQTEQDPSNDLRRKRSPRQFLVGACLVVVVAVAAVLVEAYGKPASSVSVTTYHNGNARRGANLSETILMPSNVNSTQFGKLFSDAVDGDVYAQPLYLPGISIAGKGVHNVLYVATEGDSVYAFDADSNTGANSVPLWHANFTNPGGGITTVSSTDVSCWDISPSIGITGTPVIDSASGTLYVLARTKENGSFVQRLHALDIRSGNEKFGGPVVIRATLNGLSFDPLREAQRPGLLLQNSLVYITWASHCDNKPYHGWVMAYHTKTLAQAGVWNSTPNGYDGGIWQSGGAPAADASSNCYVVTGNGDFDADTGGVDYGDTILKLSPPSGGSFSVLDYFTPYDQAGLNAQDQDLGSGAIMLPPKQGPGAPHINLLVQSGKEGTIYLIDRDHMGHFNPNNNNQIVQSISGALGPVFSTPTWWNNTVYFSGTKDVIKAYPFNASTGLLGTTPSSESITFLNFPGAATSISSNGTTNGIVWAVQTDAFQTRGPAILHAYDATNLAQEFYNSSQNAGRDNAGPAVLFVAPTVVNGKVYVGVSGQISAYGLLGSQPSGINFVQVAAATPQTPQNSVSVTYPQTQGAGDLNIVAVGWNDTTSSVQSVKDSHGNTYSLAAPTIRGTNLSQAIYYLKNIAAGSNTVTVTFNQASAFVDARALEYSGLDPTNPLDVTASQSGSGTNAGSGPATTSSSNELIFGANTVFTGNASPGPNFVARIITSPDSNLAEDEIVTTAGTYDATATLTAAGPWVMQLATFKAAGQ